MTITRHFTERRTFTRDGGRRGIGTVHRVLTRPTSAGRHAFDTPGRSRQFKPGTEGIAVELPAIIDQVMFDAVQAHSKGAQPEGRAPAVVAGPRLPTGPIHCGTCSGAMTIRTGKGRHHRYTCSMKVRQGVTACEGMAVAMERPDDPDRP